MERVDSLLFSLILVKLIVSPCKLTFSIGLLPEMSATLSHHQRSNVLLQMGTNVETHNQKIYKEWKT